MDTDMNKMKFESPDMTAQNIDRIAALFPNCVTEMLDEEHSTPEKKVYKRAVNFEMLKQMLSPDVVDGDEAYEFTWVGKKAAIVEANKPIRKTLRPCVAESKDWDTTENLYIEGDNLEVLKLLQESYLGKVKMIYIEMKAPKLIQINYSSAVLPRGYIFGKRVHFAGRVNPGCFCFMEVAA